MVKVHFLFHYSDMIYTVVVGRFKKEMKNKTFIESLSLASLGLSQWLVSGSDFYLPWAGSDSDWTLCEKATDSDRDAIDVLSEHSL